jgi:plastocyanin
MLRTKLLVSFAAASFFAIVLSSCGGGAAVENPHTQSTSEKSAQASAAPSTTAGKTDVAIDNFTFTPQTLTVAVGTKVTWINHDDVPHTVKSTEKKFLSGTLDTDDKFSFVFTEPGTYPYFCTVHSHMTGTIVVK